LSGNRRHGISVEVGSILIRLDDRQSSHFASALEVVQVYSRVRLTPHVTSTTYAQARLERRDILALARPSKLWVVVAKKECECRPLTNAR